MQTRRGLLLVLVVCAWGASAFGRTWTDAVGRKVNGEFVRIYNGIVVLKAGTRVIQVPFYSLSREDQDYLRDKLTAEGKASLVPPPMEVPSPADGGPAAGEPQPFGMQPHPPAQGSAVPVPQAPPPGSVPPPPPPPPPPAAPPPASALPDIIEAGSVPPAVVPPSTPLARPAPADSPSPASAPPNPVAIQPATPSPQPPTASPQQPTSSVPPEATYVTSPSYSYGTSPSSSPPAASSMSTDSGCNLKACGECDRLIPSHLTAGDKCPHCGVYFTYDETNGSRSSSRGPGRLTIRALVYIGVVVVAGLVELCRRISNHS